MNNLSLKQGQQFEVIVEGLAFGGMGIVKINGFVIFIEGVLPGQKVKAVLLKNKKTYGEARVLEVLGKSKMEITPKCKHFGKCGGCKWQNLNYEDQLKFKEEQVRDCLERIGESEKGLRHCEEGGTNDEAIHTQGESDTSTWIASSQNCSSQGRGFSINSCLPSPSIFGYRNKVDFSFGYESMNVVVDENGKKIFNDINPGLGFHKSGKWQEIIDIEHCDLISENLNEVFSIIKKWCFSHEDLKVYNAFSHRGFWRGLLLRENLKGEVMVNLVIKDEEFKILNLKFKNNLKVNNGEITDYKLSITNFFQLLLSLLQNHNIKSFFVTNNIGLSDDWSKCDPVLIYGEDVIYEEILGLKFAISPKSFFQTNSKGAEQLYGEVIKLVNNDSLLRASETTEKYNEKFKSDNLKFKNNLKGNNGEILNGNIENCLKIKNGKLKINEMDSLLRSGGQRIILDLYCGTGTIGQILTKNFNYGLPITNYKIIGIESVQSAVDDAIKNAKLNGLENCEFICGEVEKVLPKIIEQYKEIDLVILDPPRSGLHEKAIQTLLQVLPKQIVYVSCNPSTFSRDVKLLSEKYELTNLQPVDMFPHTAHIEVVGNLILFA